MSAQLYEAGRTRFKDLLVARLAEADAEMRRVWPSLSAEQRLLKLKKTRPELFKCAELVEATQSRLEDQQQKDASWDLEAGWDTQTAKEALQEQTDQAEWAAQIRIKIAAMRKVDPGLSFERAWDILRQKEPELFGY
jgi:hypothetical protein